MDINKIKLSLHHGDCLNVMRDIPNMSVDMILADPPYGTTRNKWDSVINLSDMWYELNRVTKNNGAIGLFGSEPFSSSLRMSNIKNYKYDWVWVKEQGTGFLNSKRQPLKNNEQISIFYTNQPIYNPQMRTGFKPYKTKKGGLTDNYNKDSVDSVTTISNGERFPLNTLSFSRDKNKLHPTQKPVALMEYLVKTYTNEGETVLDFAMGSGTTGVACKNLNRNFIGIELDDKYFEIAKKRIKEA